MDYFSSEKHYCNSIPEKFDMERVEIHGFHQNIKYPTSKVSQVGTQIFFSLTIRGMLMFPRLIKKTNGKMTYGDDYKFILIESIYIANTFNNMQNAIESIFCHLLP